MVKNLPASAGVVRGRFHPWLGNIPWRRAWQPTPVFLPGEAHGPRNLDGRFWGGDGGVGRLQSIGSQRVGHD